MLAPVSARLCPLLVLVLSADCDDGLPVLLLATYPELLPLEDSPESFNGLSGVGSNSELLSFNWLLLLFVTGIVPGLLTALFFC